MFSKKQNTKKILALSLIYVVLVSLTGIVYYLAVQLPNKQLAEISLQETKLLVQEKEDKENKLDLCLDESYQRYRDRWIRNCESLNIDINDNNRCGLPSDLVKHLDEEYKNLREECLERYKLF